MLSRQELLDFFRLFTSEISKPEAKQRIADAVKHEQEAVAITTEIQKEIFIKMGIDPQFGIAYLGKVNFVFENDRELMLQFYQFVAQEELACDEAELGKEAFTIKMQQQQEQHERQLTMLKQMRKYSIQEQGLILKALHERMEWDRFESGNITMTSKEMQEVVSRGGC